MTIFGLFLNFLITSSKIGPPKIKKVILLDVHQATGSAWQISEQLERNRPFKASLRFPLRFERCNNVVNTTFIVHCELNLLSNVEAILEQRCNSDVTKSTSLQHFVLVVQHCDLITTLSERFVLAGLFNKKLWKAVNNYYYLMMKQFGKKGKKTNFCYSLYHFTQLYLLKAKMHLHFKMTFFEDERKNDSVYAKKCHFSIIIF